jgi:hypothetical protein
MTNLVGFAVARKTSRGNLLAGWLGGGTIRIYDGLRPATAESAIGSQVNLVTFTLADPAGTVSNGVFTGASPAAALVAHTGTAAWARVADSSAGTVFDGDVGAAGSGALIEIDNISLVEGGYCSVTSFTLTER